MAIFASMFTLKMVPAMFRKSNQICESNDFPFCGTEGRGALFATVS